MIEVVEPELVKVGCLEGAGIRVAEVDQRVAPVGDEHDHNDYAQKSNPASPMKYLNSESGVDSFYFCATVHFR